MTKILLHSVLFISNLSWAGFLDQYSGTYKVGVKSCEKNNVDVICSADITKVEILLRDEAKKYFYITLSNGSKVVSTYTCGNDNTSTNSDIFVGQVVQSSSKIICNLITDWSPIAPHSQRIELKKESNFILLSIETVNKGSSLSGKFYSQSSQDIQLIH